MRFRPCIDIHNGKVKQIIGSTLADAGDRAAENFVSERSAADYASLFQKDGLRGGHVILLNPASSPMYEATRREALAALAAYPGGLQVGGGITAENAGGWLRAGASHVIVTSYVFRGGMLDEERLAELQRAVGKDRLVLDLSCRRLPDGRFVVVTDRWQRFTKWEITPENLQALCARCDEFLIHAADVEGKRGGIQEDLVRILGDFCLQTGFPVTYAGGIRDAGDLERIASLSGGSLDATVGSALRIFGGSLDLDVLAAAAEAM